MGAMPLLRPWLASTAVCATLFLPRHATADQPAPASPPADPSAPAPTPPAPPASAPGPTEAPGAAPGALPGASPGAPSPAAGGDLAPDNEASSDEPDTTIPGDLPTYKRSNSPAESPNKTYLFVGLRFRDVIVPKFVLNAFVTGGSTVNVAMAGPEFSVRRGHFEYDFSVQYADYSMGSFLFKAKSQDDYSYELVRSSLKLVYVTADILYSVPLDGRGRFAFLVGGGIGFAPVFGNIYRSQAYPLDPNDTDPDKPSKWGRCNAQNDPPVTTPANVPYCGEGGHFGNQREPNWSNGGSRPIIVPWLALPQVSFRYKPVRQLQTRADLGVSLSGFFFGLSASYGL
jgi:hypothetical protein